MYIETWICQQKCVDVILINFVRTGQACVTRNDICVDIPVVSVSNQLRYELICPVSICLLHVYIYLYTWIYISAVR